MAIAQAVLTERLTHVLRNIVQHQHTGLLRIEHVGTQGGERGELYFRDGYTLLVRTQEEWGETALVRIGHWERVHYSFFAGATLPTKNQNQFVEPNLHACLLKLLAQRPEPYPPPPRTPTVPASSTASTASVPPQLIPPTTPIRTTTFPQLTLPTLFQVEESIPQSVYAIFRAVPAATTLEVMGSMERRDRIVFMLLDGRRTVQDIARMVHRSEIDIAHTLVRLLNKRSIEYAGM